MFLIPVITLLSLHSIGSSVWNVLLDSGYFTIFEQSGNKRGTECFYSQICVATDAQTYGEGKVKAPRLMAWWIENPHLQNLDFALHCAKYIEKRGVKLLPKLPNS